MDKALKEKTQKEILKYFDIKEDLKLSVGFLGGLCDFCRNQIFTGDKYKTITVKHKINGSTLKCFWVCQECLAKYKK